MNKTILFLVILTGISAQLPANMIGLLINKSITFNREEATKSILIYGDEDDAKLMNSMVKGELVSIDDFEGTQEYVNLIFVGISDGDIENAKKKCGKVLSISNSDENSDVVALSFGLLDNKRPKILVNLAIAKKRPILNLPF